MLVSHKTYKRQCLFCFFCFWISRNTKKTMLVLLFLLFESWPIFPLPLIPSFAHRRGGRPNSQKAEKTKKTLSFECFLKRRGRKSIVFCVFYRKWTLKYLNTHCLSCYLYNTNNQFIEQPLSFTWFPMWARQRGKDIASYFNTNLIRNEHSRRQGSEERI